MISDVLCDAVAEIEHYQTDSGPNQGYNQSVVRAKIAFVKGMMTALRAEFDTPPSVTPYILPSGQS